MTAIRSDDWGYDAEWEWDDKRGEVEQPDLPRALAELRDGIAPPPPNAGAARARRIEAVKAEIAACQAFIDDCDFMADDLKTTSCTGTAVPGLMRDYLCGLRAYQVSRKLHLEAERDAKRGVGVMCDHSPNREAAMVDIAPGIWCDPCLASLVKALNDGGLPTVASCCGHGRRPAAVALDDGRFVLVMSRDDFERIDGLWPGINDEPATLNVRAAA